MNRNDLKKLASLRLKEAKVLLDNACYDGAYYLLGYVIECGIKACIAKKTRKYDFPEKGIADKVFIHDLERLLDLANLSTILKNEMKIDPDLETNWTQVIEWKEACRYDTIQEKEAKDLFQAVRDTNHGVLQWLKRYW